jgi:hypothetical protein
MTAISPPSGSDPETTTVDNSPGKPHYVKTAEMRSEDDHDTCLRPLGLCELGGSCDSCWYRPDHPRFQKK